MAKKTKNPQSDFLHLLRREVNYDPELVEPSLWFQRLCLVKRIDGAFEEDDDNCIREMKFRPGLNILWAEPEEFETSPESLYEDGYAGHSTGKTLFCRILRYLLGEANFGTESLREELQSTILQLWVVATIRLDKQTWLVGRALSGEGVDFAIPDSDFDRCGSLAGSNPPYDAFTDALEQHLGGSLQSQFAGEGWRNLLPWIARDQEARFASMIAWRDSSSEADNPRASAEVRHLILRAVLGFLDPKEVSMREKLAVFTAEKESEEGKLPVKRAVADTELRKLRANLAGVRNFPCELEDFGEIRKRIDSNLEGRKEASAFYKSQPESTGVTRAREALEKALGEQSAEVLQIQTLEKEIPELEKQAEEDGLFIERAEAQGLTDSARIDRGFCPMSYPTAVENKCIDAPGDGFEESMANLEEFRNQAKARQSTLTAKIREKKRLEKRKGFHQSEVPRLRKALAEAQTQQNKELRMIEKESVLLGEAMKNLKDAKKAEAEVKKVEGSIASAKKRLEKLATQLRLRTEDVKSQLKTFESVFSDIVEAVIGSSVTGKVSLLERGLKLHIEKNSELGGAALESVKTIAFDLAAVVHSIEGNGHHPRFLIHDGPREADMARVIYERFFHYVSRMEDARGGELPLFQYIITTTTPPPEGMREGTKWLLGEKLSGKTKEGRFLKEDF